MSNFTDQDLARIDKAIAQGALSVEFADGRTVQFSTFKELVARRNFIARQLGEQAGRQRLFAEFKKGVRA
ncbi:MAG: phage head-tail joining protein [Gemmatimonadota bacterium]